jgi:signal transduction histidine kinase
VEEHHGRIEVSSVEGKGSKFTVLLPFQMPDPEASVS